jgi:SecD/SecF fusion protein
MKKFGRPFALIGLTTLLGLAAMWPPKERIKLGIDLSGGTILVYQAKESDRPGFSMDELIGALKKRINPEGTKDIVIRKVGGDRVEIILPKASTEDVEDIKRRMTAVGAMQFRILADRRDLKDQQPIERALGESGLTKPPPRYRWAKLAEIVTRNRKDAGDKPWVRIDGNKLIDPTQVWERDQFVGGSATLSHETTAGVHRAMSFPIIANDATSLTLDPARAQVREDGRLRTRPIGRVSTEFKDVDSYLVVWNPARFLDDPNLAIRSVDRGNGVEERYVLYKLDNQNVTGDMLSYVHPTQDEQLQPAVGFQFFPQGANRFGRLTRDHAPGRGGADFQYRLAILLDDQVMSAPSIRQEIRDSGIIEGMELKSRDELIDILRAGKLPASIDPVPLQQENIGPTLGKDTIDKGLRAIAISMLIVPIFMVVYYRFAGLVAVVALLMNMILLVGSMALTQSSFTLPGLAGLALTIGMAVDANVLIFERMREEAERGANMGTRIRNGFNRAWTTILDSNVTTMLSGMVLWAIGTEEVKGFAITLIIGLIWNLFTAVYVSRVIFEYFYQKGWLKKLTMMKLLGKTEINFVGPRRYMIALSVLVISAGMISFVMQGGRNFNIDFTGGTLVTMQLDPKAPDVADKNESQRIAFVRQQAAEAGLPNVSVESLSVGDEQRGTRFNIRTTLEDAQKVQEAILQQFGPSIARLTMSVGPPEPIPQREVGPSDAATRFAGGTRFALRFNREVDPQRVLGRLEDILRAGGVSSPAAHVDLVRERRPTTAAADEGPTFILQTNLDPTVVQRALNTLAAELPNDASLAFERLENFGAAVARDTQLVAVMAIVASWLVIIAYLWLRFKSLAFGLAAVIALVHDVLVALGAVALSPYKIDLPMIAAFLTLIGFSVNDTIVIFDRIRELKGKTPYVTEGLVNAALNQTLARTILTSLTAFLVVVIMYLFGGEGLRGFSFCLVVGFLSGTYSTIYIASPVLVDWLGRKAKAPAATAKSAVATAPR